MANYGTVDGYDGAHYKSVHNAMRLFPIAFTLVCVLLFMVPTYLILYMVHNPVVTYWFSTAGWGCIIIPFVIGIVHMIHVMQGAPNKFAILLAIIVPSIILLIYADLALMRAMDLGQMLFSVDCDTLKEKRALQRSWEEAYDVFDKCITETAAQRNLTTAYLAENYRLQDCTEYPEHYAKHSKHWGYLRMLEETQYCSGFCTPGAHLWSKSPSKDSCSVAISSIFTNLVHAHSVQVLFISLITLGATFAIFIAVGPILRENGIDW